MARGLGRAATNFPSIDKHLAPYARTRICNSARSLREATTPPQSCIAEDRTSERS